jgi:hypothetical protein
LPNLVSHVFTNVIESMASPNFNSMTNLPVYPLMARGLARFAVDLSCKNWHASNVVHPMQVKIVACSIRDSNIQWFTRRRALSTKPLEMRVLLDASTILNP